MPRILGIEVSPPVEALIDQVNAEADRPVQIRSTDQAPAGVPRFKRGVFYSPTNTIFINTGRDDTDEHAIAHELAHALLFARGWLKISSRKELDPQIFLDWDSLFNNRLQHIAMEPLLRAVGFDTRPGHRVRAEIDLARMRRIRDQGGDPNALGEVLGMAVKLAEVRGCGDDTLWEAFSAEVDALAPDALRVGRELVAAIDGVDLSNLAVAREACTSWIETISREIPEIAGMWTPKPREWLGVQPIFPPASELQRPAREVLAFHEVHYPDSAAARIFRLSLLADGSTVAVMRPDIPAGVPHEEVQDQLDRLLNRPLASVAQWGIEIA